MVCFELLRSKQQGPSLIMRSWSCRELFGFIRVVLFLVGISGCLPACCFAPFMLCWNMRTEKKLSGKDPWVCKCENGYGEEEKCRRLMTGEWRTVLFSAKCSVWKTWCTWWSFPALYFGWVWFSFWVAINPSNAVNLVLALLPYLEMYAELKFDGQLRNM